MITKKQVEHVAKLSRIELTETEIEKYQHDLAAILGYIEKLNEIDTEGIEPTSHVVGSENFVREDAGISKSDFKNLIEQAPDKDGDFFRVKAIL